MGGDESVGDEVSRMRMYRGHTTAPDNVTSPPTKAGVGWFKVRLHGGASQGARRRMFRDEVAQRTCTKDGASNVSR